MMIANNKIVIGNDGGVYSRPLSDTQQYGDWRDLNATLRSWQYYDARAGQTPGGALGCGAVFRTTAHPSCTTGGPRWPRRRAGTVST